MKTITSLLKTSACLGTLALAALFTQSPLSAAEKTVASFESDEPLKSWTSVNDGVMGGISKGGFKRSEQGTLLFTGDLSLENNGGFASIRMKPSALGLSGMSALVVKARGDGRTYWVDLRVTNQMNASSYRAYLPTTAGEWQETRIPFADFKLQAFGRELPVKPLNVAAVTSVGFTLADKKAGPFALEIGAVNASGGEASAEPVKSGNNLVEVAKASGGFKTLLAAATAADLVGVLSGEGPLTVLAPTDEAFAKLPSGTVETLLKPENREQLVGILKNHVIAGRVTLAKALEARGHTVTRIDMDRDVALRLSEAKPDVVFQFHPGGLGITFARQYQQAGLLETIPMVVASPSLDSVILKAIGDAALGIHISSHWNSDLPNAANKEFVAAFQKKYGRIPSYYASQGYDTARAIGAALKGTGGKVDDTKAFSAAMRKADFQSVRGDFKFGPNNHPINDWYSLRVERASDGNLAIVTKAKILENHSDFYAKDCKM